MIALFDSGNSRLHFGWWNGKSLTGTCHVPYPESPESLHEVVVGLMESGDMERIVACSVSPVWRESLYAVLERIAPEKLHVVRTSEDIGVRVAYDEPDTYGVDRAAADCAAYHYFHDSCVVVNAGTALTVDAVGREGGVAGGFIFPGRRKMSSVLAVYTDLPVVSLSGTEPELGTSTVSSIAHAVSLGFASAAGHLVARASSAVDADGRIIVTGGDAEFVVNHLNRPVLLRPDLVLEGLGVASERLFCV